MSTVTNSLPEPLPAALPNSRRPHLGHFLLGLVIFIADQLSKGMIDRMPDDGGFTVIPGMFRIIHAENPGVAFGLFQNAPTLLRSALIGASSVALMVVLALLWRTKQTVRTGYAMALIVGGACGNLFDRILHGKVVDFLLFYHGGHSWPVFNLADSAIVIGAGLLVWEIIQEPPPLPASAPLPTTNEAGGESALPPPPSE